MNSPSVVPRPPSPPPAHHNAATQAESTAAIVAQDAFDYDQRQLRWYPNSTVSAPIRQQVCELIEQKARCSSTQFTLMDLGCFGFKQVTERLAFLSCVAQLTLQVVEWSLPDSDIGSWRIHAGQIVPSIASLSPVTQTFLGEIAKTSRDRRGPILLHTYNESLSFFMPSAGNASSNYKNLPLQLSRRQVPDVCVLYDRDIKFPAVAADAQGNCMGGDLDLTSSLVLVNGRQPLQAIAGQTQWLGPWQRSSYAAQSALRLDLRAVVGYDDYGVMLEDIAWAGAQTYIIEANAHRVMHGRTPAPQSQQAAYQSVYLPILRHLMHPRRNAQPPPSPPPQYDDLAHADSAIARKKHRSKIVAGDADGLSWCACTNATQQTRLALVQTIAQQFVGHNDHCHLVDVDSGGYKQLFLQVSALAPRVSSLAIDAIEIQLSSAELGAWSCSAGSVQPDPSGVTGATGAFLQAIAKLSYRVQTHFSIRTFGSMQAHAQAASLPLPGKANAVANGGPDIVTWVDFCIQPISAVHQRGNFVIGQQAPGCFVGLFQLKGDRCPHVATVTTGHGCKEIDLHYLIQMQTDNLSQACDRLQLHGPMWHEMSALKVFEQVRDGADLYIICADAVQAHVDPWSFSFCGMLGNQLAEAMHRYQRMSGWQLDSLKVAPCIAAWS